MGQKLTNRLRLGITEVGTQLGYQKKKDLENFIEDFKIKNI